MEYRSKFQDEMVDQLFRAILALKSMEECYRFFEDICTIHEIKSLAQRLEVARMLREKRHIMRLLKNPCKHSDYQ
jgi:TrpR-related protein YerC/YecD